MAVKKTTDDIGTKDALKIFGQDFQYTALKLLVEDPKVLPAMNKLLDANMFENVFMKDIVERLLGLWRKVKHPITWAELKWEMHTKSTIAEDDVKFYDEQIETAKSMDPSTMPYVKSKFVAFTKWMRARALCNEGYKEMTHFADEDTINKFIKRWKDLTSYGEDSSVTTVMTPDFIKDILTADDVDVIPTFIPGLDDCVHNLLERGGLGLFEGPSGFGKTTFASVVAYNVAMHGYRVLQIYFEDTPVDIGRKHASMLYRQRIGKLKYFSRDKVGEYYDANTDAEAQQKLEQNLKMCQMADRATTVEDIEAKMNEYADIDGWRPDVLIIDYFSCLKMSANSFKDKTIAEANAMRKIKALALQYNMAVWVMQQTNRGGATGETTGTMGSWQGAYEAIQPASVWITLFKNSTSSPNGTITIKKSRFGREADVLEDIVYDNGSMIVDCSEAYQSTVGKGPLDPLEYHDDEPPEKTPYQGHGM